MSKEERFIQYAKLLGGIVIIALLLGILIRL